MDIDRILLEEEARLTAIINDMDVPLETRIAANKELNELYEEVEQIGGFGGR